MLKATNLNRKTLVIRVLAAALLVLVFVQPGRAAISFNDGGFCSISGGTIDGGLDASNGSIVDVSGEIIDGSINVSDDSKVYFSGGKINGSVEVGDGSTFVFEPAVLSSSVSTPEPITLVVWSLLSGLAIGLGWWQRPSAA